ncbi:protein glutamate methyltransferase CheR associated with MCPs of class 40H, TPR domain-containing [Citrifermentans bemidjiense Bem]|uniref:Protein glutamate methyltransferase CheR associated with MCPs of class 40H, TPR domain-containing n=2 Tax=Citrifermentans bemidjiense TaxID=225194 RepID=B5ECK8_CITBB|nr:protein glutamate methyltransferase CheR associated with MCPs of class 40H, TPR domain-containing [Citrifermentans bemidjiense Bem]
MSAHSNEAMHKFAHMVTTKLGLHFPPERLAELARKMAPLAKDAGWEELDGYLHWLMSQPLSLEQTKALALALTIGETYFLRDPKSYRAFQQHLLPKLLAAKGSDKSLKIWSAGCSSGEEPYSIAILLTRALADLADWKVTLLGTDINPQALERARCGTYSKWSFRNAPGWLMNYFTQLPDGNYQIEPHIRKMVRFAHLNLVDPGEKTWSQAQGMDFIFCRNVMLYFHPEQIRETVARLHAALNDGGWLFLGPTEVDHQALEGFTCLHCDGTLVLQKRPLPAKAQLSALSGPAVAAPSPFSAQLWSEGAEPGSARKDEAAAEAESPLERAFALYSAGNYEEAARMAMSTPASADKAEALALAARSYANIGRFDPARDCCEAAVALDRLSAPNHYLLSIILEQQGDGEGAVRSLRNALYVDHDFLLGWFALGNLCRQRGELREAEQSFANALRLLQRRDPHEVLPEAEGMTAGRLMQLISDIA